jgi:hypothetical protein
MAKKGDLVRDPAILVNRISGTFKGKTKADLSGAELEASPPFSQRERD